MGSVGEDELRYSIISSRKFKFPRKIIGDSNTVNPTSVPRKLRSAIKKRCSESVNGVEPHKKKNGCSLPISKDEEEVAETLFALAGMVPLNDLHIDNNMMVGKTSNLPNKHKDPKPAAEDNVIRKEKPEVTCHRVTHATTSKSAERKLGLNLKVSIPPVKLDKFPTVLRTCDQMPLMNSTFIRTSDKPCQESRLKETKQSGELLVKTGAVDVVANQENPDATSMERRDNGLTLRALNGFGVDGFPTKSSAIIFPSWLSAATSSSRAGTYEDTSSIDKVSCSKYGLGKSWKRCARHVNICRFIQVLQISEGKDIPPLNTTQLRSSNHSNNVGNHGENEILSGSHMFGYGAYKNACERANGIPVNPGLHQEQGERPSFSGCCGSKNKSFDFLSLSTGFGSTADNGVNRSGNSLESRAKGPELYPHSVAQHNTSIHYSMPQNHVPSNPYRDQATPVSGAPAPAPAPAPPQVTPYFGNPFGSACMGSMTTAAPQHHWTAQPPVQFRPGPLHSAQISNWQNMRQQPSSIEVLGTKYLQTSQQQQSHQLIGLVPSLPPPRAASVHPTPLYM